jgi:DNA-binding MarR family transcriptional regulator
MGKKDSIFCRCLYYSANAFARLMTKMAEEEFSITGLSPSYAFLLMSVNDKPGIHPKELSEVMLLTPSTVTRLLEKLEHKGLLERKSIGKITEVHPTIKSLKINDNIKAAWSNLYDRYSEILGEEEGKSLTAEIYKASQKIGV